MDNGRILTFHHGNAGVRGAEVDANHFRHLYIFLSDQGAALKQRAL